MRTECIIFSGDEAYLGLSDIEYVEYLRRERVKIIIVLMNPGPDFTEKLGETLASFPGSPSPVFSVRILHVKNQRRRRAWYGQP